MTYRFRPCIIVLVLLLAAFAGACTPRPASLLASKVQGAPLTAVAPTFTLTPQPTPLDTATLYPTPTATPTTYVQIHLPVPQPLSGQAPWLAFPCADAGTVSGPTIASSDGTGCVPFTLPS